MFGHGLMEVNFPKTHSVIGVRVNPILEMMALITVPTSRDIGTTTGVKISNTKFFVRQRRVKTNQVKITFLNFPTPNRHETFSLNNLI